MAHLAECDAALLDRRTGEAGQRPSLPHRLLVGDHRGNAGQLQCRPLVYRFDAGVRVRAAQHGCMRHVRQRDVIDKAAATDQETRILLAQHAGADDVERLVRPLLLAASRRRNDLAGFRHQRTVLSPRINSTARSTELMMSSYPVQRHMLSFKRCRMVSRSGLGFSRNSSVISISIPGVQ